MEGGRVYAGGGSELMNLLENSNNSVWVPSSSPSFHETMVNFDHERQVTRVSVKRNYGGGGGDEDDNGGEEFETKPEKKRRLTPGQVEFLEKSFERENKLEPDRKMHLAKTLGLQPRQVAIWFQNRRARYKTKQLEKEYGSLKASYDQLKLDFDALSQEKDHLHNEVKTLTMKLKQRDEQEDMTLANMLLSEQKIPKMTFGMLDKPKLLALPYANKQLTGDATSAKSDVSDSESPHCTDGNNSSLMEDPTDQQSEFSQDEEELLFMNDRLILPSAPLSAYSTLLKVEDTECYEPNASTGNFSLVDDQPPFWSMLY